MKKFRVWLARQILGDHCPCWQMGGANMVNFQQRSCDKLSNYTKGGADESYKPIDFGY